MGEGKKRETIERLQRQILDLQGLRGDLEGETGEVVPGPVGAHFPGARFPAAAVHQFLSRLPGEAAATNGFLSALVSGLCRQKGPCLWVSTRPLVYPPGLKAFGVDPERVIFVQANRLGEALWTMEQGLQCSALGCVVGELSELGFRESRRLQLAVEKSRVTGLLHCYQYRSLPAVACLSRWKVQPLPSELPEGMPGLGFPHWRVELLRVRNGRPGAWTVECRPEGLRWLEPSRGEEQHLQTA